MKNEGEPQQTETDRMVGDIVIYGLIGLIGIVFFLPTLLGMLIFAIIHIFKRDWISYVAFGVGLVLLFWQFQAGNILTYFGLISEMNAPFMSTGIEQFLNAGDSIEVTSTSYAVLSGLALVFSFGFFIFAKYFWKKRVTTKSGEEKKQKSEQKYKTFRNKSRSNSCYAESRT